MSEEGNLGKTQMNRRNLLRGGLGVAALALGAGAFGFKNLFVSGTHAAAAAVQPAAAKVVTINVEKMVQIAWSKRGDHEGSVANSNNYSKYWGHGPEPWCADFASWAVDQAGNKNKKVPWGNPSYVPTVISWARSHKKIVSTPRRGDLFANRDGSHMGIVTGVNSKKHTFTTIEGNTSRPGYKGDRWVWTHEKVIGTKYYFIRISQDV